MGSCHWGNSPRHNLIGGYSAEQNPPEAILLIQSLREKCSNTKFFWSVFSSIRTEYGERRSISPYSHRLRENTDQKNSVFGHFSRSVVSFISLMKVVIKSRKSPNVLWPMPGTFSYILQQIHCFRKARIFASNNFSLKSTNDSVF